MSANESSTQPPLVGLIMGSISDWKTMQHAALMLEQLGVPYEKEICSAHRTPDKTASYAATAAERGLQVIIAAAGGAAHLAGLTASHTHLPVLGVPMRGWAFDGMDSLLSTVQMPAGVPVPTLAVGKPGAVNAAVAAASILALNNERIRRNLIDFRAGQTEKVLATRLPEPERDDASQ